MADTSAKVSLLMQAKDETAGAFEAVKGRLENVKGLLEHAFVWQAGELIFDKVLEGAKDFVSGLISANANVETLKTSLTALYGSATEASAAIEYMTKFSLAAPFAKDDILAAGQALVSVGADITQALPALGNVAAVMGASLPAAADALDKAMQTGSLRGLTTDLHISKAELEQYGLQTTKSGAIITSTLLPAFEKLAASPAFKGGMTAQLNTFNGSVQNLKNQFDNLMEVVGKPIFDVLEKELAKFVSFLSAHQADVNNFATTLGNAFKWYAEQVGKAYSFIGNAIATFSNWFGSSALPVIETVIGYWIIGWNALGTVFSTGLSGVASAIVSQVGSWATAFGAWIGPAFTNLVNNWPKLLNGFLDLIGGALAPIAKQLARWGVAFVEWLVPRLPELIKNFALFQAGLFKMIAETAIILPLKLAEWGLAIITWIGAQVKPWVAAMLDLGQKMIEGMVNGIKNKASDLKDAITGTVSDAYNSVKSFLHVSSPSKLFFDIGVNIGQGLIDGLKSMQAPVAEAMKQMAGLPEGLKSSTGPSTAQPGQTAQQIGAQWLADHGLLPSELGGGKSGDAGGLGLSAPNLGVPAIAAAAVAALKSPALAGLTTAAHAAITPGPQLIRSAETGLGDALLGAGSGAGTVAQLSRSGAGNPLAETVKHLQMMLARNEKIISELQRGNDNTEQIKVALSSVGGPIASRVGAPRRLSGL